MMGMCGTNIVKAVLLIFIWIRRVSIEDGAFWPQVNNPTFWLYLISDFIGVCDK